MFELFCAAWTELIACCARLVSCLIVIQVKCAEGHKRTWFDPRLQCALVWTFTHYREMFKEKFLESFRYFHCLKLLTGG